MLALWTGSQQKTTQMLTNMWGNRTGEKEWSSVNDLEKKIHLKRNVASIYWPNSMTLALIPLCLPTSRPPSLPQPCFKKEKKIKHEFSKIHIEIEIIQEL